jgi:hypothetical protein
MRTNAGARGIILARSVAEKGETNMSIRGACLCGTVRYEIDGPFTMMMSCHCSMCRKHHGAPFATFAGAPIEGFRWLAGEDAVQYYASSPNSRRGFCRVCGSVAPTLMKEMGLAVVPAGTLEGDPGMRPTAHLFVGSKAPWYTISDSLPQHDTYPPEWGEMPSVQRPVVTAQAGKTLGSCLCGEVAYEMTGPPVAMYQCHCSRCRKSRASAHGANLFYKLDDFRWTRGEENVVDYKLPEAERFAAAFCRKCGGSTPRVAAARRMVVVPAGPLDTDPGMRPMAHIFVGSKAPWFEITGSTPQFAEMPPPQQ